MQNEKSRILKELATRFASKYYPEYLDSIERIWASLHGQSVSPESGEPASDAFGGDGLAFAMERGSAAKMKPALLGIAIFSLCEDEDGKKNVAPIKNIPLGLQAKLRDVLSEYFQAASPSLEIGKDADIATVDNLRKLLDEKLAPIAESLDKSKAAVLEKIDVAKDGVISHIEKPAYDFPLELEIVGEDLDNASLKWKDRLAPIKLSKAHAIFLCVLALHAKRNKKTEEGASERDIFASVSVWKKKNPRYIAGIARELRERLEKKHIANVFEATQWNGYKLSVHPSSIKVSESLLNAMKGIVGKESPIGKIIFYS